MIAEKALACADEPHLVFDYDHQSNCEAFANLVTGAAPPADDVLGAQEGHTHCCIAGICHFVNCLKVKRSRRRNLAYVVQKRLNEREIQ